MDTSPVKISASDAVSASPMVLVGAGHAHLVALRRWAQTSWRAPQGSVLINPDTRAWYSGMMPGLIAGRFGPDHCTLPLAGLCKVAGVELLVDRVSDIDSHNRYVHLNSGRVLHYKCLSLNSGSMPPKIDLTDDSIPQLAAKPFQTFLEHWKAYSDSPDGKGIAVIGGGAAAFELALALRTSRPSMPVTLLCGQGLLGSHGVGLRRRAQAYLDKADIRVYESTPVTRLSEGNVFSHDDVVCQVDAVVLATGASALPWYQTAGLNTDSAGFVSVNPSLQSTSHPDVFAAGDCASLPGSLRSGVYSVRHGAVLAHNIPAWLSGKPLLQYSAQKRSLALLATADGGALVSYGRFSAQGRLAGIWKDYLDLSFIRG